MTVPMYIHKPSPAVDFTEFIHALEAKHGFDIHDIKPDENESQDEYRNFWHHLLDTDFNDLTQGSYNYIDLNDDRLAGKSKYHNDPEWTLRIFRLIREEVQGNPALDIHQILYCWVDW